MKTVSANVLSIRLSSSRKWLYSIALCILLISLTAAVVPGSRKIVSSSPNQDNLSVTPTPKINPQSTTSITSTMHHGLAVDDANGNTEIVVPAKKITIPQQPATLPRLPQQPFIMPDIPSTSNNSFSANNIPSIADTYRFSPLTTFKMPDFPEPNQLPNTYTMPDFSNRYIPPTTYTMPTFPDRYVPPTTYTMPSFPNTYVPPTTYTMPSFPNRYVPPTTYTMPSFPSMPSIPRMPSLPLR
jgi:hypothetical protein